MTLISRFLSAARMAFGDHFQTERIASIDARLRRGYPGASPEIASADRLQKWMRWLPMKYNRSDCLHGHERENIGIWSRKNNKEINCCTGMNVNIDFS
jgi:hypothetical protein